MFSAKESNIRAPGELTYRALCVIVARSMSSMLLRKDVYLENPCATNHCLTYSCISFYDRGEVMMNVYFE